MTCNRPASGRRAGRAGRAPRSYRPRARIATVRLRSDHHFGFASLEEGVSSLVGGTWTFGEAGPSLVVGVSIGGTFSQGAQLLRGSRKTAPPGPSSRHPRPTMVP